LPQKKRPFAAIKNNCVAKGLDIYFIEPNRLTKTIVLTTSTNPRLRAIYSPQIKLSNLSITDVLRTVKNFGGTKILNY